MVVSDFFLRIRIFLYGIVFSLLAIGLGICVAPKWLQLSMPMTDADVIFVSAEEVKDPEAVLEQMSLSKSKAILWNRGKTAEPEKGRVRASDPEALAKEALRLAVKANWKKILLVTSPLASRRDYRAFVQVMDPIGIQVGVVHSGKTISWSNWFQNEGEVEIVFGYMGKYLFSLIKGVL